MSDHHKVLALADQCVKCGMCQTVCPTYRLQHHEAESPRGRIALIQGLLENRLPLNSGLITHLDNCLQCRACEALCPSRVAYGAIMDFASAHIAPRRRRNLAVQSFFQMFNRLLNNDAYVAVLRGMLWIYQKTGLRSLGQRRGWIGAVNLAAIPVSTISDNAPTTTPAARTPVTLFTGCMSDLLQPDTQNAAIRVLAHLGFDAVLPDGRQCCGALHRRHGDQERAQTLQQQLTTHVDTALPVVSLVSACALSLREHSTLKVMDFSRFVEQHWPSTTRLPALPCTLLVHEACSLRNGLREHQYLYKLLGRIPEAAVLPLENNPLCCGAAGTHRLSHPEVARTLVADKVDHIAAVEHPMVVTTNLGCALHLTTALRQAGLEVPVLHPAQVLASLLPSMPNLP